MFPDRQCPLPLRLMDELLQSLANALGVQGKRSNPMRPEAAVAAFTGLFERDDLRPGLRVMVFRLHKKRLPHALGTIYERTNASLEAAGSGGMGSASKPRQGVRVVQVPVGHAVDAATAGTGDNGGPWVPAGGLAAHPNGHQP